MINAAIKPPRRERADSVERRSRSASRRRAAIARYEILDTAAEADFDGVAMLAARICAAPFAAISFIDDDRQWFKAKQGLGICETPIGQSFCAFAIRSSQLFVVKDARFDARFAMNPLVTGPPHIRFYAGMRILAGDGTPIASLCVLDTSPRPDGLTGAQEMTLRVLAAQVQSLLELRYSLLQQRVHMAAQDALSAQLQYVAQHDELTGLPHRGVFHAELARAVRHAQVDGTRVAVMLVDVDHFKQINDSLGHDVGDALLCAFAKRLRATMRGSDVVARLGGDEFGIVLTGIERDEQVTGALRSLDMRLHDPVEHNGRMVDCRASIGVAVYPDHAATPGELVKCSDLALAEAKIQRARAAVYCSSMSEQFERETRMLDVARIAIAEQRIEPHYQPKIDLRTGQLAGFEALVRCSQASGALLLPEAFSHAFADRELARQISEAMLHRVMADVRSWVDNGVTFGHVALNTCAADFHGDSFAERLLAEIDRHRLRPRHFEIEVTEGVFLGRGAHFVSRALAILSNAGMRIALDDFGTGFASLTHLKQFPVDVLKIDRSFVAGIGVSPDDSAIVRALIGLGRSLGIQTVAEGVETVEQAAFVKLHGCDVGQGYLFGEAGPASSVPGSVGSLGLEIAG